MIDMRLKSITQFYPRIVPKWRNRRWFYEDANDLYQQWFNWLSEQWKAARTSEAPEIAIVQFYVDLWDKYRSEAEDNAFEDIQKFVAAKLEKLFNLVQFFPTAYQDYQDGWIQRANGSKMVSGRVREILRPGLQDNQGNLRVPSMCKVD